MRISVRLLPAAAVILITVGCATTKVDMTEPRRLVGTENGVRLDAQIIGEQLTPGRAISITYDVSNERPGAVAIADLLPECSYDPESQTVTVTFGSEIPGFSFLPRLLLIPSGGKKTFTSHAVVSAAMVGVADGTLRRVPRGLQVKLHFLDDPKPFEQLIGIPERTLHDPQLADALLPKWLERNETVVTNVLPMRWVPPFLPEDEAGTARRRRP